MRGSLRDAGMRPPACVRLPLMDRTQSEQHIVELRRTLHELVEEAERRVANLEAELAEARVVLTRMRKAVSDADEPFRVREADRPDNG